MRQRWALAAVLVLLTGCIDLRGGKGPGAAVPKRDFVQQLVELCAGVNRQLASVDPKAEPVRVADQLDGFVKKASALPRPNEDKASLDRFLSAVGTSAQKFRVAQAAVAGGKTEEIVAAEKEASTSMEAADKAGQAYGMPHLSDCDKELQKGRPGAAASGSVQPPPAVAWRTRSPAPVARQQVAATVLGGTIWVIGGLEGAQATVRTAGYDPAIDTWKAGPDLPIPLHHAMAVAYKGELVVMGGWTPQGSDLSAVVSDRVFALRNGGWVELPKLKHPRAAGAAGVVGDKIVVVGGQANRRLVRTTEIFDSSEWTDAANIPTPREHLAAAVDESYLYAVGGRELSSDKNKATLERYNPDTNRWEQLPPMPTARGGLGAAIADGRLLAVGGEQPTGVFGTVEAYDIASSLWSTLPSLETPRHGMAVAAVDRLLYAIDGAARPSHTATSAVVEVLEVPPRRLQPATTGWQARSAAPVARQQVCEAVVDGTIWVVGGLEGTQATARTEGYDPAIDTWKAGPDLPIPLHHCMAVTYRGELVVMGGWSPQGPDLSAVVSDRVFALRNGGWVELPKLNRPRAAGAAGVVGSKIVVVGGQANKQLIPTTEVFDGTRWTDAADIPTPREHVAAGVDGSYVYAVGGRELSSDKNKATLERYNPDTNRWEQLPPMPTARGGLAATVIDGRLVAVGGEQPTGVFGTVEAYDIASAMWSTLPSLKTPRHGLAVVAVDKLVYAINGAAEPSHTASSAAVEVLEFS